MTSLPLTQHLNLPFFPPPPLKFRLQHLPQSSDHSWKTHKLANRHCTLLASLSSPWSSSSRSQHKGNPSSSNAITKCQPWQWPRTKRKPSAAAVSSWASGRGPQGGGWQRSRTPPRRYGCGSARSRPPRRLRGPTTRPHASSGAQTRAPTSQRRLHQTRRSRRGSAPSSPTRSSRRACPSLPSPSAPQYITMLVALSLLLQPAQAPVVSAPAEATAQALILLQTSLILLWVEVKNCSWLLHNNNMISHGHSTPAYYRLGMDATCQAAMLAQWPQTRIRWRQRSKAPMVWMASRSRKPFIWVMICATPCGICPLFVNCPASINVLDKQN